MFEQITHPKKRAFLSHYAQCAQVKHAAKQAHISRELHYDWLQLDSDYALAFQHSRILACEALEDEAAKRAFQQSDRCLVFLLEHLKPGTYGKKATVGGELTVKHQIDLTHLSDEELDQLERLISKPAVDSRSTASGADAPQAQPHRQAVPEEWPVSAGIVPEAT